MSRLLTFLYAGMAEYDNNRLYIYIYIYIGQCMPLIDVDTSIRYTLHRGRDRSIGIATRYGMDGLGIESLPIPVAKRSKAKVCGRTLDGVAGSNLAGDMDACVV
jgi:hypothetical protein